MPPRTPIEATEADWQRLALEVRARRIELGLSQGEVVARTAGQVSLAVWSVLERAAQVNGRMDQRILQGASRALGWVQSGAEQILSGKSPDPAPPAVPLAIAALDGGEDLTPDEMAQVRAFASELIAKRRGG